MYDFIGPLFVFAFATSFTPGPNVVMLAESGANYGFRSTIPHITGISVGFPVMVIAIGLGLKAVFVAIPELQTILKFAGGAYLLYLAWRIANAGRPDARGGARRPMNFLEAAGFQWVNPKGWMMAVAAVSTYTPGRDNAGRKRSSWLRCFALLAWPSCAFWAGVGVAVRLFASDRAMRNFNLTMAALLVASLALAFWE
jgi:threonine/homoserine/homoserine lactone efflux protein